MMLLTEQDRKAEIASLHYLFNLESPRKNTVAKDVAVVAAAIGGTLLFAYCAFELGTQVWRALTCC